MVEVFKTNVETPRQAEELLGIIHMQFTEYRANFDLEDCDKILRVRSSAAVTIEQVVDLVQKSGFKCAVLPD